MIFHKLFLFSELSLLGFLIIVIIAAVVIDLIIGDPRWFPHPVIQIGKLISVLEKRWNQGEGRKIKGFFLTCTVLSLVFCITLAVIYLAYDIHLILGIVIEIYIISTTIAIKGLRSAAMDVWLPLTQGNLEEARERLSRIVGRDTEHLQESEIVRGTVETVAENTVDGITAPLFWAVIGGAPLAMVYRAINTLDSMVGYKNEKFEKFGYASAKLDDIVNWLPARLTAWTMLFTSIFIKGSNRKDAIHITWRDAKKHPSPNSGWPEAMVAGLMAIQLGGVNYYNGQKSERATMGEPMKVRTVSHIKQAILYMHGGWIGFILLLIITVFFIGK
ncbi:adenosylcobinamide-phosphate synthase [Evansella vedderi]|uniref:Cobalamin biosynthesis protein CobD n=1 Tax=Evansella vedderi TaxID=38282 RepID=A0ABT9ZYN3_9BACI|nr:adenosylcobinamide-phosphate synthase CbiB [Evansella vedderi]MDQ0256353.1 adenosylcobinamide-phosphate synthase [Evansella vedderi]